MRITKIAPFSLAKVLALIFAVMSFIFTIDQIPALAQMPSAWLYIIGSLILAPLFYALVGLILGFMMAHIYNIFAKKFGGLRFEVE